MRNKERNKTKKKRKKILGNKSGLGEIEVERNREIREEGEG